MSRPVRRGRREGDTDIVKGSRTIRVTKRDGSEEPFDRQKLTGAMWRAMEGRGGSFELAGRLAGAIETYLTCRRRAGTTSAALFEMTVKVLRAVRLCAACEAIEAHQAWRAARRRRLLISHDGPRMTLWDKSWLAEHARRSWHLSRPAARLLAGEVETALLARDGRVVSRREVVGLLNAQVAWFGLADAVPVPPMPRV